MRPDSCKIVVKPYRLRLSFTTTNDECRHRKQFNSIRISRSQHEESDWSSASRTDLRTTYNRSVASRNNHRRRSSLDDLVTLLLAADAAIENEELTDLVEAVATFAELVCRVAPFRPRDPMPPAWRDGLAAWLGGRPASEVILIFGSDGVDFPTGHHCVPTPMGDGSCPRARHSSWRLES